jgi:coenzyme F420-reducing hydrogenase delta subunit
LVTGIDLPHRPLAALRVRLQQGLAAGARQVIVGCDHGARIEALAGPRVLALTLPCSGMLPPSFVDYALQQGAASVLVSGCREGGCEYRLGPRWTEARLRGEREPHLRPAVPADRWRTVWADAGEERRVHEALEAIA